MKRTSNHLPYDETPPVLFSAPWILEIFLDIIDENNPEGLKVINIVCDKKIAEFLKDEIFKADERIIVPCEFFWLTPESTPFPIGFTTVEPDEVKFVRYRLYIGLEQVNKALEPQTNKHLAGYAVDG